MFTNINTQVNGDKKVGAEPIYSQPSKARKNPSPLVPEKIRQQSVDILGSHTDLLMSTDFDRDKEETFGFDDPNLSSNDFQTKNIMSPTDAWTCDDE